MFLHSAYQNCQILISFSLFTLFDFEDLVFAFSAGLLLVVSEAFDFSQVILQAIEKKFLLPQCNLNSHRLQLLVKSIFVFSILILSSFSFHSILVRNFFIFSTNGLIISPVQNFIGLLQFTSASSRSRAFLNLITL